MGRWQLIIVSVYVHCKTHRKRSGIEMNETLNLHRQRTKWTADIELDNFNGRCLTLVRFSVSLSYQLSVCWFTSEMHLRK